ncbi:MAG: uncharacterized protein JWP61_2391 [Friedmanniella sp.]|nr:uncharacterized protein [Friedmanniella sp.]
MASTQQSHEVGEAVNSRGRHVHHGRTGAAWAGSAIAMVAFVIGGWAVVVQNWPLFWVGAALLVIAAVVGLVLQRMGYGAH